MATVQAWAPPLFWGPWVDLMGHTGSSNVYTVSFETESETPSSFDVEIEFATETHTQNIYTQGPGNYQIMGSGAGTDRIRFKSHSIGQVIKVEF
ncbi:colicin Z C-terminal domain-related protein [Yersinia bercovieri]|uniref:Colicin type 7 (Cja) n=1 Tax=Yersinia bercovieri TaxID=634 RepID=A0A2G4U613_YERBE|nr:colicin Z C-terminal domain-related protein [Yersinia bercovieri]MDN0103399.1 colicin Z C-terminal domain-related protein [Yersinia bercovieri]PHZ28206.1 hypothetical protein CS533_08105 [Yersinia bercovieri]QKJ05540.1 hypothetical protein HRK25_00510 [Yersinia bercovieri ATCC 43970]CFQ31159.1 colicin type 7 (Cja) [Yersinia bercovieri]CNI26673.1 colicin type 7 (Cja) [Yersinia bercovieri]